MAEATLLDKLTTLAGGTADVTLEVSYQEQALLWNEVGYHMQMRQSHIGELFAIHSNLREVYEYDMEENENYGVVATLLFTAGVGFVVEGTFPPTTKHLHSGAQADELITLCRFVYSVFAALALVFPMLCVVLLHLIRMRLEFFMQQFNSAFFSTLRRRAKDFGDESQKSTWLQESPILRRTSNLPTAVPGPLWSFAYHAGATARLFGCTRRLLREKLPERNWTLWRYVVAKRPMELRAEPRILGIRTLTSLQPGEEFWVDQEVATKQWRDGEEILCLHLADGSGWTFETNLAGRMLCDRVLDEFLVARLGRRLKRRFGYWMKVASETLRPDNNFQQNRGLEDDSQVAEEPSEFGRRRSLTDHVRSGLSSGLKKSSRRIRFKNASDYDSEESEDSEDTSEGKDVLRPSGRSTRSVEVISFAKEELDSASTSSGSVGLTSIGPRRSASSQDSASSGSYDLTTFQTRLHLEDVDPEEGAEGWGDANASSFERSNPEDAAHEERKRKVTRLQESVANIWMPSDLKCGWCLGQGKMVSWADTVCDRCKGNGLGSWPTEEAPHKLKRRQMPMCHALGLLKPLRPNKCGSCAGAPRASHEVPLQEEVSVMLSVPADYLKWRRELGGGWSSWLPQAATWSYWASMVFNILTCVVLLGMYFAGHYSGWMWFFYLCTVTSGVAVSMVVQRAATSAPIGQCCRPWLRKLAIDAKELRLGIGCRVRLRQGDAVIQCRTCKWSLCGKCSESEATCPEGHPLVASKWTSKDDKSYRVFHGLFDVVVRDKDSIIDDELSSGPQDVKCQGCDNTHKCHEGVIVAWDTDLLEWVVDPDDNSETKVFFKSDDLESIKGQELQKMNPAYSIGPDAMLDDSRHALARTFSKDSTSSSARSGFRKGRSDTAWSLGPEAHETDLAPRRSSRRSSRRPSMFPSMFLHWDSEPQDGQEGGLTPYSKSSLVPGIPDWAVLRGFHPALQQALLTPGEDNERAFRTSDLMVGVQSV